jgi:hypothetical protein
MVASPDRQAPIEPVHPPLPSAGSSSAAFLGAWPGPVGADRANMRDDRPAPTGGAAPTTVGAVAAAQAALPAVSSASDQPAAPASAHPPVAASAMAGTFPAQSAAAPPAADPAPSLAAMPAPDPAPAPSPSAGTGHKPVPHGVAAGADPTQQSGAQGVAAQPAISGVTPAATAPASPPSAATPPAHPATPADQLAPALLTLTKTASGFQQMTIRLQPAALGMVEVRIVRALAGTTQIAITAESPATLMALQRDQAQLHRTLDQAGIPGLGRTVTFHVAQPAQEEAGGNAAGSWAGHGSAQPGTAGRTQPGATHTGATDADGAAGGFRGSYTAQERNIYATGRRPGPAPADAAAAANTQSYHIGLDITA